MPWVLPLLLFTQSAPYEIQKLGDQDGAVLALAVDPTGKRGVTAGMTRKIALWDLTSKKLVREGGEHPQEITAIGFPPDGQLLVTACADRQLRLWDVGELRETRNLGRHDRRVFSLSCLPNLQRCITATQDGQMGWWTTLNQGRSSALAWEAKINNSSLLQHTKPLLCSAVDPAGKWAVAGSSDGKILRWNLATGIREVDLFAGTEAIHALVFDESGTRLLSAGKDQVVRLWDFRTGQEVRRWESHPEMIYSVAFAGSSIVAGGRNGTLVVWSANDTRETGRQSLSAAVNALASLPTGELFLGLQDGTIALAKPITK